MCNPMALAIAGGVVSAVGSIYGGLQQGAAYDEQATFAERQARLGGQVGAYERERLRTHHTRALASMRQQYSSSGVDPTSGSAREVIEDSTREAALDEEAVLFGAKLRADNQRFEARLARSNAQSARVGGFLGAFGDLIGGASKAAELGGGRRESRSGRTFLTNGYA
jgi:hypothetical protein